MGCDGILHLFRLAVCLRWLAPHTSTVTVACASFLSQRRGGTAAMKLQRHPGQSCHTYCTVPGAVVHTPLLIGELVGWDRSRGL